MRALLAVLFLFLHAGAAEADELADMVDTLSSGSWGWPEGDSTCRLNPQILEFSSGNDAVIFRWNHTNAPAEYDILYHDSNSITMILLGEERLTDSGDKVIWQLRLIDNDHFCWRRTDWPSHGCTADLQRCEAGQQL